MSKLEEVIIPSGQREVIVIIAYGRDFGGQPGYEWRVNYGQEAQMIGFMRAVEVQMVHQCIAPIEVHADELIY